MVDFENAEELFEQVRAIDPYALEGLDAYSNILYVTENKKQLSMLAHAANNIDPNRAEACCIVGSYSRPFQFEVTH
jgi:anaphase-promoting complex subunit 8